MGAQQRADLTTLRPELVTEPACIHCGLCLEACPTYSLFDQHEADSPRGRIHLLAELDCGGLRPVATLAGPVDRCLGCLACETACPSGVRYRHILARGREQLVAAAPRSWRQRLIEDLLVAHVLTHPRRLRALARVALAAQALGLLRLARRLLPGAVLPPLPWRLGGAAPSRTRARGRRRGRAGLLSGCVGSALFADINRAAVTLLADAGWDVVVPPRQGCCGALDAHAGRATAAQERARVVSGAFDGCDIVVSTAAGCGAALEDAGLLAARGVRCLDLSEALLEAWLEEPPAPAAGFATVAYHDACHLAHARGVRHAPRRLLELAGCHVVEAADPDTCCGGAGTYFLSQPAISRRLLDRKLADLTRESPDCIVTANPGCLLQLRAAAGGLPVHHLATFLVSVGG